MQDLGGQLQHEGFYCLNIATNADSLATWLLPTLQAQLIQHKIVLHFQVDDQSSNSSSVRSRSRQCLFEY